MTSSRLVYVAGQGIVEREGVETLAPPQPPAPLVLPPREAPELEFTPSPELAAWFRHVGFEDAFLLTARCFHGLELLAKATIEIVPSPGNAVAEVRVILSGPVTP
jgi:hypothetical protein